MGTGTLSGAKRAISILVLIHSRSACRIGRRALVNGEDCGLLSSSHSKPCAIDLSLNLDSSGYQESGFVRNGSECDDSRGNIS